MLFLARAWLIALVVLCCPADAARRRRSLTTTTVKSSSVRSSTLTSSTKPITSSSTRATTTSINSKSSSTRITTTSVTSKSSSTRITTTSVTSKSTSTSPKPSTTTMSTSSRSTTVLTTSKPATTSSLTTSIPTTAAATTSKSTSTALTASTTSRTTSLSSTLTAASSATTSPKSSSTSVAPTTTTLPPSSSVASTSTTKSSTTVPSSTVPSSTLPSSTLPSSTLPSSTLPSSTVPSSTVPSSTLPSSTVPSSTLPSSTVPSSTVPSSTLPSSTVASTTRPSTTAVSTTGASTTSSAPTTKPSLSTSTSTIPSSTSPSTSSTAVTSLKPSATTTNVPSSSSSSRTSTATPKASSSTSSGPWPARSPQNVPVMGSTVDYGYTTDPNFNIFRDGGGGVTVAGHNIMMFSDSYTTNGGPSDSMTSFMANTFAYAGTNASNPRQLADFGSNGIPVLEIALMANETYQGNGRYAIWPSQSMITFGNTAVGVVPLILNTADPSTITYEYNTLVQVTIGGDGNPVATRLVQSLFTYSEIPYGSLGMLAGPDGYTYLFASDNSGMKAARVVNTLSALQSRSNYQYYNQGVWSNTMPAQNDATSNVFNFTANYFGTVAEIYSAEMFFSAYHNTYLIVFMDSWVDGAFQVAYSTTGQLTGPWSNPTTLYSPAAAQNAWNYAGHAYPGMDPSGQTLTLTYTYNNVYIKIAKVTFCNGALASCSDTSTTAKKRSLLSETITYEQFIANNGPCRVKFPSGCNVIVDETEYDSNVVLKAHLAPGVGSA